MELLECNALQIGNALGPLVLEPERQQVSVGISGRVETALLAAKTARRERRLESVGCPVAPRGACGACGARGLSAEN